MNLPIAELIRAHASLVNDLKRYDYDSVGPVIAAMLTLPEFHANNLRLDALAHLACVACAGKRHADREALARWIGRELADSPLCQMEDPVEDVFVGNAATTFGNFRVFRGLEESGDFWLERMLRPLPKEIPGPLEKTMEQIRSLLALSDAVAGRLKLERYTCGSGVSARRLAAPQWRVVRANAAALCFTKKDLKENDIQAENLEPFILADSARAELKLETLGHTGLERCPLRASKTGCIVVVAPPMIISCVQRFFLEQLKMSGFIGFYDSLLHIEQVEEWFASLHHAFGFQPLDLELPLPPANFPPLFQTAMSFDDGKYAHVLLLDGNIQANLSDCHGMDRISEEHAEILGKHMLACATMLRKQAGFNGGMTLITRGGVGARGLSMRRFNLGIDWAVQFASLSDWSTLARCDDMSGLRLWRMCRQLQWAKAHGLEVMNNNGLLNLFACWRANNWRFLVPQVPIDSPQTLMALQIDFLTSIREHISRDCDRHSCLGHDGKAWLCVERYEWNSLYSEDRRAPMYVVPNAFREGVLLGLVTSPYRRWWIVSQPNTREARERSIVFELWECLMKWMNRAIPAIERSFTGLPMGSIWVELEILDLPKWNDEENEVGPANGTIPKVAVAAVNRALKITLPAAFREEFHFPENFAEEKLVGSVFEGLENLTGNSLSFEKRRQLLAVVFPNTEPRFFHVVQTENWAHILAGPGRARPNFIPQEDRAQSLVGLAAEIGNIPPNGLIKGHKECLDYLQIAVDKLRERVETLLRQFDRESVIRLCFGQLAELEKDDEHWRMTARAQIALRQNRKDVLDVADERRSNRDAATLMNRLLIETAMYACSESGGRRLPSAEHLELLAHMQNLVLTANHRDAIKERFMVPQISILPNGELQVDDRFYASVMAPYVQEKFTRGFTASAKNYERWFSGYEKPTHPEATVALNRLDVPFKEEFGFTIDQLAKIPSRFGHFALEKHVLVIDFNDASLRGFLERECSLDARSVDAYISRFSLFPRRGWNKDLPAGLKDTDVFPWRFRRRLSLLLRPLILVQTRPEKRWLVYPPIVKTCGDYLVNRLGAAGFPVEHFLSEAMRRFMGDQANRQGYLFANRVADECERVGFLVRRQILMKTLGVPDSEGDFGDVDVLAWRRESPIVMVIECKHLRDAASVRDVVHRLDDYRGEGDDSLVKHLRRAKWLGENNEKLSALTGHPAPSIEIRPLLVTNHLVPMQFFSGSPMLTKDVVCVESLAEFLKKMRGI